MALRISNAGKIAPKASNSDRCMYLAAPVMQEQSEKIIALESIIIALS